MCVVHRCGQSENADMSLFRIDSVLLVYSFNADLSLRFTNIVQKRGVIEALQAVLFPQQDKHLHNNFQFILFQENTNSNKELLCSEIAGGICLLLIA